MDACSILVCAADTAPSSTALCVAQTYLVLARRQLDMKNSRLCLRERSAVRAKGHSALLSGEREPKGLCLLGARVNVGAQLSLSGVGVS